MDLKQIQKSAKSFLEPIVNNKTSLHVIKQLTKYPKVSLHELGRLTGLSPKALRRELIYLTKQNLVCFDRDTDTDGTWHLSLNTTTLKNLVYLPLYVQFVHNRYEEPEQLVIMNLLLNFSKRNNIFLFTRLFQKPDLLGNPESSAKTRERV